MSSVDLKKSVEALDMFVISGNTTGCIPYGNGHINNTFLVTALSGKTEQKYILQKVNRNVFRHPDQVVANIEKVIAHLKQRVKNPERNTLNLIPAKDGKNYCVTKDSEYWRMYKFIDNALCLEAPRSADDFYESGIAFGQFQQYLSDFDATQIFEVISNFHNTPKRYEAFLDAVKKDPLGRVKIAKEEIEFVIERKEFTSVLEDYAKSGQLPLRVTHNDTKINNVMLTLEGKALCVIDLDTVMPGYSVTDFGDAIRFGASTAAEDERDVSKVNLDLSLYETFAKGYIKGCNNALTKTELELFPEGAKIMTLECGMRFLTDYILGDTYFKTKYPEHNLVRTRTQFKLVKCMEENWEALKKITAEAAK